MKPGHVLTQEDGTWLHPGKVTDLFARLIAASGLPPLWLHDLRHGAANLTLAAGIGVGIKTVSATLGRSPRRRPPDRPAHTRPPGPVTHHAPSNAKGQVTGYVTWPSY
ncbi:hypothetical protein ACFYXD_10730 [Streptomyces platensis]|uniref:hypothetical protein n=1 Tax=Streptomyces platensis TaxID=58346 RepID=UPI0036B9C22A